MRRVVVFVAELVFALVVCASAWSLAGTVAYAGVGVCIFLLAFGLLLTSSARHATEVVQNAPISELYTGTEWREIVGACGEALVLALLWPAAPIAVVWGVGRSRADAARRRCERA